MNIVIFMHNLGNSPIYANLESDILVANNFEFLFFVYAFFPLYHCPPCQNLPYLESSVLLFAMQTYHFVKRHC